jgi:nucleoside-diphosphate-sugar epimerase
MQRTVIITGAAGYVGEMLCELLHQRQDVRKIIALDKEPQTNVLKTLAKLEYVQTNLADEGWQELVARYEPDTIIHAAWQIRALYGNAKEQWRWNIDGSNNVFDLALSLPSVRKLIFFSTAASYSARMTNTLDHYFTEAEGLRDDAYIYAKEKKTAEESLKIRYEQAHKEGKHTPQIFVLRPSAITGPRGRFLRVRFGLQSALAGTLKGGFVNKLTSLLTGFMPAPKTWVRQFIHEDDVVDIVATLVFEDLKGSYEVFNITPNDPVDAEAMAQAVGKKVLPVTPVMVRFAFAFFYHATQGKIPTCSGSWRFYSYPILMDGSRITTLYGYTYRYSSIDAITYTDGRYANSVPSEYTHLKAH